MDFLQVLKTKLIFSIMFVTPKIVKKDWKTPKNRYF
jgi:hypothetical protein